MKTVAALFVLRDSVYKTMPGVDCYDEARDARTWQGGCPVVAHPPCRSWGRLRHMSHASSMEHSMAPWAVMQVRRWGGVLEHPAASSLWTACRMPRPGRGADASGGFTIAVEQYWWGHRAQKKTWLYVCGCATADIPAVPLVLSRASHVIAWDRRRRTGIDRYRPHVTHRERSATPPAFAEWLIELARKCIKKPMEAP